MQLPRAKKVLSKPVPEGEAMRKNLLARLMLKWYGKDFGPTTDDQLRVLRPLLPAAGGAGLAENPEVTVRFLDYDWGLNDQQPPSR
jgi:hypothetical protein